ncbi:MAG: hypothetical protein ACP5Q1_09065, partial [Anaerolineae bacterium]
EEKDRPYHTPTYGTIQAVKPNGRLVTCAFSPQRELLEHFALDQCFLLGKKRTMFQIVALSMIAEGQWNRGICTTGWLELPPHYGGHFQRFEVLAGTLRYIVLRGITRWDVSYVEFSFPDSTLCLPDFYLEQTPMPFSLLT